MPRQSRRKKKTTSLSSRMRKSAVARKPSGPTPAVAQGRSEPAIAGQPEDPIQFMPGVKRAQSALEALQGVNRRAAQGQYPSKESVANIPTPEPYESISGLRGRLTRRRDQARSRLADLENSIGSLRERLASPMSPADMRRAQAQRDPFTAASSRETPGALSPIRGGVPIRDPVPGTDLIGTELTQQPGVFATEEGFIETVGEPPGSIRRDQSGTYVSGPDGTVRGRLTPEGRFLPSTREGLAQQDAQRNRARRRQTPLGEAEGFASLRRALESPDMLGGAVDTEGMTVADAMQARREGQEQMARQSRLERMLRTPQGRQELAERAQAQASLNQLTGEGDGVERGAAGLNPPPVLTAQNQQQGLTPELARTQELTRNIERAISDDRDPREVVQQLKEQDWTLADLQRARGAFGSALGMFWQGLTGQDETIAQREAYLQHLIRLWKGEINPQGKWGPPNSGSSRSRRGRPNEITDAIGTSPY